MRSPTSPSTRATTMQAAADPGQHGAQSPPVALAVEARHLLVGRGRGPEPE